MQRRPLRDGAATSEADGRQRQWEAGHDALGVGGKVVDAGLKAERGATAGHTTTPSAPSAPSIGPPPHATAGFTESFAAGGMILAALFRALRGPR
jgi:hypothetical protein